jgi:arylsulfatase A-like enzyme
VRAERPFSAAPAGVPPAVSWVRAALLGAALSLLLFLFEQGRTLAIDRERLSLILAPVYALLLAGLAALGGALLRGLGRSARGRRALDVAAGGYFILALATLIVRWLAGAPVHGVRPLLAAAVLLALTILPSHFRFAVWLRAGAAFVLLFLWARLAPERWAFGESYLAWLAHAAFLALILALLLAARRGLALPRAAESIGLLLLGAAALAVHLVAGASIFDSSTAPARASAAKAPAGPRRPNVVLVVWDSVRRDHLSAYGYGRPTTPFLAELARRSVVYTRAVSTAPWTLPSHASMMTGLYPRTHGAHSVYRRGMDVRGFFYRELEPGHPTLAGRLRAAGYRCGAVSANFYFAGRRVGLGRGFDWFFDDRNPLYLDPVAGFRLAGRLLAALETRLPIGVAAHVLTPYISAREVSGRALDWIDAGRRDRPFFLFLNYMEAHEPYNPGPRHRFRYPGFRRPLAFIQVRDVWFRTLLEHRAIRPQERDHLVSQYDGALMTLDEEARRLVGGLARRGLFDDTLLVFTSDHGELLGEHGMTGHGQDLYEELIGIPLIVKYPVKYPVKVPGERRRGRDDRRVENRDLFHWILAAAGAGGPAPPRPWEAAAERYPAAPNPLADGTPVLRLARGRRAVLFGPYKFIASSDGEEELYDLARDPGERANLVRALPEVADHGRDLVRAFLQQVPEAPPAPSRVHGAGGAEDIERLRALGYAH